MITYWPSPAKLNLFLYVTGKREDGYHILQTLFQFLEYGDTIAIKPRLDGNINFRTPIINISNKNNLIIQAIHLLMQKAKQKNCLASGSGADIYIKKRLPIGSGLGGGSSNAATVLIALNYLWKCNLSDNDLSEIGLMLGADVPVFIRGFAAFAEGVGEILSPAYPREKWYLVLDPGINISTSMIFKKFDLLHKKPKRSIKTLLNYECSNVFELIVRKRFLKIDETFSWIQRYAPSRLTGTGSCIFSEFNSEFSARYVLKKAPKWLYRSFIARGVNHSPLKKRISRLLEFKQ